MECTKEIVKKSLGNRKRFFESIAGQNMTNTPKTDKKSSFVMVTFGRGADELKRNFDRIASEGGYTNAGLALELIREGIARRLEQDSKPKPKQK